MRNKIKIDKIGKWSEDKLKLLKKYLEAYTKILKSKRWCKGYYYVDAFAGTGKPQAKDEERFIDGSPLCALTIQNPFTKYYFIEKTKWRVKKLEKMKKEAAQYSEVDLKLLRREKLNPKTQKEFRLLMLGKFFQNKSLTKDEMEEIKEELELNGVGEETIIYKDNIDKNMTKESILRKRGEIEKQLLDLLKNSGSEFTLEEIKEIIYNEKGDNEFSKIISTFDHGQDLNELNNILQLLNDAWNYFPHKCLNGLCPMEKILEHQEREKSNEKFF